MKLLLISFAVALAVGSGAATSASSAIYLYHHKHMTLDSKINYFNRSIEHDQQAINWLHHARHDAAKRDRWSFVQRAYNLTKRFHKALRWHQALLAQHKSKWNTLHPPPPPVPVFSGLPPHYSAWLCIHQYEGSWDDDGSPYYGGLQMDLPFQASYGSSLLSAKGTANNWTPLEQMWVAERAFSSGRGFYPWPNTARACGLI